MKVVILAAGKGLRLRPFTEHHPKGLVPVNGMPLLRWALENLPKNTDEIFIIIGWLGEQIKQEFGNTYNGIPISYFEQSPINGTGSALHTVKSKLTGKFLVINGDDLYWQEDLQKLTDVKDWGILAKKTQSPIAGSLEVKRDEVIGIKENNSRELKWQNCGSYLLDANFFELPLVQIPVREEKEYSLPHTIINNQKTHSIALVEATKWLPLGTPEELAKAKDFLDNI